MNAIIEQFKTTVLQRIRYNTLQAYTSTPKLEDEQLFFLLLPQLNGEQWSEPMATGAIATAIVHTSLNEHDKVLAKEAITKEQQLIVLAGDYYSGRYYQLLAQSGNIVLIQKLSAAIIERCEHEIKVYEPLEQTLTEWIDSLMVIKTALIERFYEVFGFSMYAPMMKHVLVIHSLQQLLAERSVPFFKQMVELGRDQINQEVRKHKEQVSALLAKMHYSEEVKRHILAIVE